MFYLVLSFVFIAICFVVVCLWMCHELDRFKRPTLNNLMQQIDFGVSGVADITVIYNRRKFLQCKHYKQIKDIPYFLMIKRIKAISIYNKSIIIKLK